MVFSSLTFLFCFLPALYLLLFLSPHPRWRNGVLIAASLLFYGWGEPVWVLAMLFSTAVNYVCALLLDSTESRALRRLYLTLGVIASVCFLFYFKYSAFLLRSVGALLHQSWDVADRRLPIGISFYTFQILTYTVDVYRGKAPVLRNPLRLLLYISCFPQLIAGPIVQYGDVADQLAERRITPDAFAEGMERFTVGLAKRVLLANLCGAAVEELPLAGTGAALSVGGAWFMCFLYGLQIYFDFSAYSDMAIGLGRTLGFRYKENFDYPFASLSVTEFWRRWHISLGSFFRDYVYIPLGGSRRGKLRTAFNILLVWSLTGLWHGASWNFVVWGAYFGVLLVLERFGIGRLLERLPAALRWVLSSVAVLISWAIFYYTDFSAVLTQLGAMFGIGASGLLDPMTVAVLRKYTVFPLLACALSLPLVPALRRALARFRIAGALRLVLLVALFVGSVLFLIGQSYNPFIYFRF